MSQLPLDGIGRRIARYRKMNGWSARQLARNTDDAISRDTIANLESGRRGDLSLSQFLSIALALRVPPVALLIDLQHPFAPSAIQFPGVAPAPLEPAAPQISMAQWLNGQADNDTTTAGRWVADVTALLADYLAAANATEVRDVLQRLVTPPNRAPLNDTAAQRRTTRAALETLGVEVPEQR